MIAAAIGSPINHKPPSSKNPKPLGAVRRPSSNAYALPAVPGRVPSAIDSAHAKPQQRTIVKDCIIVLTIHLGQVYRADGLGLLDPKALWTLGFVAADEKISFWGYRTMLKPGLGWDLSVNKGQPKNVPHCSNKLPNLLSIYQFLILLEKQLKLAKYNAKNLDFDISKTSGFRLVFDKMVSEMGTAAGLVITKNAMPWEWELYRRILDGERQLPKVDFVRNSLGDNNKEILELRKKFVPQDGLENGLKENPPLPTNPPLHMNPSPPSNPPSPSPRTTPPHMNTPLVPKKQSKDQTWDEWIDWDVASHWTPLSRPLDYVEHPKIICQLKDEYRPNMILHDPLLPRLSYTSMPNPLIIHTHHSHRLALPVFGLEVIDLEYKQPTTTRG
ncbi:hypothetical protein FB446DRAFT_785779 [Lentinula raphanica]|nr:hypothetical protein FB446DRAFT_785779 [Lentinula raphanica]